MAEFKNKIVLVAGGAGEFSEGIARQFLKVGAMVIVPSFLIMFHRYQDK